MAVEPGTGARGRLAATVSIIAQTGLLVRVSTDAAALARSPVPGAPRRLLMTFPRGRAKLAFLIGGTVLAAGGSPALAF